MVLAINCSTRGADWCLTRGNVLTKGESPTAASGLTCLAADKALETAADCSLFRCARKKLETCLITTEPIETSKKRMRTASHPSMTRVIQAYHIASSNAVDQIPKKMSSTFHPGPLRSLISPFQISAAPKSISRDTVGT